MPRQTPDAEQKTSDEDIALIRQLYDEGQELDDKERRRRGLGYRGLAKKFGVPWETIRDWVKYRQRVFLKK